jgi:hypothetical protein
METTQEAKFNSKNDKNCNEPPMESMVDTLEQMADTELSRAQARVIGGRSIDRGDPEDDEQNIESDDEGMIEEIVTTVEEDKDLECKVKTKIETKKTIAQDPDTLNKITRMVKTEVTEITRTITINDQHDLERAKRELGIDDVNRFLPQATWPNSLQSIDMTNQRDEPIISDTTSKSNDLPRTSSIKQSLPSEQPILAEATTVGRGPVIETITLPIATTHKQTLSSENKSKTKTKNKKNKNKSGLCSCTRAVDDDAAAVVEQQNKPTTINIPEQREISTNPMAIVTSVIDAQVQSQALISSEIKQLIVDKKYLLIDYMHSTIFSSTGIFSAIDNDVKERKMSSRVLDLLRYDRCSSWTRMFDQLRDEYDNEPAATNVLRSIVKTYENLFTHRSAHLLNTFSTIHHENDLHNISENQDYRAIVQTCLNDGNHSTRTMSTSGDNINRTNECVQDESTGEHDEKQGTRPTMITRHR